MVSAFFDEFVVVIAASAAVVVVLVTDKVSDSVQLNNKGQS